MEANDMDTDCRLFFAGSQGVKRGGKGGKSGKSDGREKVEGRERR